MPKSLLQELEQRWDHMFAALAAGGDVPPGVRLRAEGMMEAVVLGGHANSDQVLALMDARYQAAFGCSISEVWGADWRAFFPFPQIPAMGRRAPVYPSTRD